MLVAFALGKILSACRLQNNPTVTEKIKLFRKCYFILINPFVRFCFAYRTCCSNPTVAKK
jgi:hypothetical protein